jgi:hypothetical protein
MASEAVKALVKRLDSVQYDPSKLVQEIRQVIRSEEGSLSYSRTRQTKYDELKRLAGQRLALGVESFESAKSVLRFLYAYIEQYANPRVSDSVKENSSNLLLKAILRHIRTEARKDMMKGAFSAEAKTLKGELAHESNQSRVIVTNWSSFFGFSEKEEVELLPTHVLEAIKVFIDDLGDINIPGGTVPASDIFEYPPGVVRNLVPFPGLKAGNMARGAGGSIDFAGPAKRVYDSLSIEGLVNAPRMGFTLGSARGYAGSQAVKDAEAQHAKSQRQFSKVADGLSKTFERFAEQARGSASLAPGRSRLTLANASASKVRNRSRSRNRNTSQTRGHGGASGVGLGKGRRRTSRR